MHPITILIPTTPERRERLSTCVKALYENSDHPFTLMTYENNIGWVGAVLHMLSLLNATDIVCIINDDCIPQKGWLKTMVEEYFSAFSDGIGLAQPNDGIMNGSVATLPMGQVGYLEKNICSEYKSYYADTELTENAVRDGKYIYVDTAVIEHHHWSVSKGFHDATYASQEVNLQHDMDLYSKRRREREFNSEQEII